jgi:hypothetical protein
LNLKKGISVTISNERFDAIISSGVEIKDSIIITQTIPDYLKSTQNENPEDENFKYKISGKKYYFHVFHNSRFNVFIIPFNQELEL